MSVHDPPRRTTGGRCDINAAGPATCHRPCPSTVIGTVSDTIEGRVGMKVFVAGATGAVGKRLVPMLLASGYDVTAATRSAEKASWLSAVGANPVVVDALDRNAVIQAVVRAKPDVVLHELTGLVKAKSFKRF